MAIIRITDLSLETIIGIFDWERKEKHKVVINVEIDFNAAKAIKSDCIQDTVDYKTITKKIIRHIQASNYFLLEKMTESVLKIVMEDPRVKKAKVRIDKPGALRFARSVSFELEGRSS